MLRQLRFQKEVTSFLIFSARGKAARHLAVRWSEVFAAFFINTLY
jgi:hypothetical protein